MSQPAVKIFTELAESKRPMWAPSPLVMLSVVTLNLAFGLYYARVKTQQSYQQNMKIDQARSLENQVLDEMQASLKKELKAAGLDSDVKMDRIEGGLAFTFPEMTLFGRGMIDLNRSAETRLASLGSFLAARKEMGMWLLVEGHTDDSAINGSGNVYFRTNWELSGARAAEALRVFVKAGYPANQAALVGFGDTRPLVPNRDELGKIIYENQTKNRRIVVKMVTPAAANAALVKADF